jgi:molecular chaperone GrpE
MTKSRRQEQIDDAANAAEDAAAPGPQAPEAQDDGARPDQAEAAAPQVEAETSPEAALQAEVAALKDQLLRALAEVENTRRRAQRDREEALRYGPTGLARDLLTVADNLRRAIESVDPDAAANDPAVKSLLSGVELTERELLKVFDKHHIAKVEPMGAKFDAHLHQAMFEVPDAEAEPGTVVQVLQPGYVLHDRLLRAAMVGVARRTPSGADGSGSTESGSNGSGASGD